MFGKLVKFCSLLLFLLPIVVYIASLINAILLDVRYAHYYFNQIPLYITQISFYIFIITVIVIYTKSALKTWWLFLLTALIDFILFFLSLTLFQRIYFSGVFEYPISDVLGKAISTYIIALVWILIINFFAFSLFVIINSKKIKMIPSVIYIFIALIFKRNDTTAVVRKMLKICQIFSP